MKRRQRRRRRAEYYDRSGYSTDKKVSMSKFPKGPGPGAEHPKNSEKK